MENKTCDTCFWCSRDGYCTERGRDPHKCTEACDKHTPKQNVINKS